MSVNNVIDKKIQLWMLPRRAINTLANTYVMNFL